MKRNRYGSCNGANGSEYSLVEPRRSRGRHIVKLVVLLVILFALVNGPWRGGDAQRVSAAEGRNAGAVAQPSNVRMPDMHMPVGSLPSMAHEQALGTQSYLDGLTLENGEVLSGDVSVFSGDARIEEGARIDGSLVVFRGDLDVADGAEITGDVTLWNGDADIQGRIGGSLSVFRGDVKLDDTAWIGGDVSTLRGDIDRDSDAWVAGAVLTGSGASSQFAGRAPQAPVAPAAPDAPDAEAAADAPAAPAAPAAQRERGSDRGFNPVGSFFGLVARLFAALFFTFVGALIAMAIYSMRPQLIDQVQDELRINRGRSVAVGLVTVGSLYVAARLLMLAWCFVPLALVPSVLVIGLAAVGLTAQSRSIGQRMMPGLRDAVERKPASEVALGAVLLGGSLLVLSAIFGWGEFWTIVGLIVASPGVGALVNPRLERYRNREVADLTSPGTTPPSSRGRKGSAPVAPVATGTAVASTRPAVSPAAPAAEAAPALAAATPTGTPAPAAPALGPIETSTPTAPDAPAELGAVDAGRSGEASAQPVDLGPVERPAAGGDVPVDLSLPEQEAPYQADPTLSVEDLVAAADADTAARQDAAARAERERMARVDTSRGDDFTRIRGLGRAAERKLKGAGIYTYAELAALPVEIIARVLSVPVEEVIEDQIAQQANLLVRGLA